MATFFPRPLPAGLTEQLAAHGVPFEPLEAACRNCSHLDGDDVDYPKGFDQDLSSEMLGSGGHALRLAVISTGRSDWPHSVGDDKATLAGQLDSLASGGGAGGPKQGGGPGGLLGKLGKKLLGGGGPGGGPAPDEGPIKGLFPSSAGRTDAAVAAAAAAGTPGKLSLLNSSFLSSSDADGVQSVLVFPDFKVVHDVPATAAGAAALSEGYLAAGVGRAGPAGPAQGTLRSWPLPYHAVVLLCSHKKRDARCAQAAPLLLAQFQHHLERHGLDVDTRGDDLADGPPIEEWEGDRPRRLEESLRGVSSSGGRVGIFNVSHIGGHRYAGVMQICFPNGTFISYGRVRPTDVGAIVESTLLGGRVIPELLRGGWNLTDKPGGLLSW